MVENNRFLNLIGEKWKDSNTKEFFEDRNPANTKELIGLFPKSNSHDVNEAVEKAEEAYNKWHKVPAPKRGDIMYRIAGILEKHKEDLARLLTRENGKILIEARGDVQEAIDTAYYTAGEGRRLFGFTTPSELPNKFAMATRAPIGVCGIITPWNFPIAIPSWKIFPAIMSGNTVVFKPASDTPLCGARFVELLLEAGLHKGVVNIVHGSGTGVGMPLIRHPNVRAISFTGSSDVGRTISEEAGKSLKRVSLELGGKNAQIVLEDANIELAIKGALWGAFATAGQRCTATSRLILEKSIKDKFLKKFIEEAKKTKIGDGLDETTQMGPLINEERLNSVSNYVKIGQSEGADLVLGGSRLVGTNYKNGYFFSPTIFDNVKPNMRIAKEEIFGPVLSVFTANNLKEAIDLLNNTSYGLSSSIYTNNVNNAFYAMENIETGIVYVNGPTIGAETHLPFGGMKDTGNGHREASSTVFDFYTEWKTVYFDYSGTLQRAQIDD